ncbi:MAG: META domain-containing protein [Spirochaetales bacterium]|nr:META domain-containing protein [Spirochaetales bacterium]
MKPIILHRLSLVLGSLLFLAFLLEGCASSPPPVPEPPPVIELPPTLPPPPPPPPEPESEPIPPISLEGYKWTLTYLYGTDRVRVPDDEIVWISFIRDPEGRFFGNGGVNQFFGAYNFGGRAASLSPDTPAPLEGSISLGSIGATKMAGRYLGFENVFFQNLGMVQGYLVRGSTFEDGRLVLFGGYGGEEIILVEFRSELLSESE